MGSIVDGAVQVGANTLRVTTTNFVYVARSWGFRCAKAALRQSASHAQRVKDLEPLKPK